MMMRLLRSVTVLLHVRYILCDELCGKTTVVNGAAGGDVSLRMNEENVDDVTWSYKYNRIASTGPHKPMNVTPTYSGKLASDQNGSLIILNLWQEDEGSYNASIKLRSDVLCTAHYQLHVYQILSGDEIKISHNVLSHEPCRVTLTCTANGSDVTIAWSSGGIIINNDVVNVTDPDPKTLYICTTQNPVSNATMAVTPREYCGKSQGNKTWIGVTISVAVLIIVVAGYLYYRRLRRRSVPVSPS